MSFGPLSMSMRTSTRSGGRIALYVPTSSFIIHVIQTVHVKPERPYALVYKAYVSAVPRQATCRAPGAVSRVTVCTLYNCCLRSNQLYSWDPTCTTLDPRAAPRTAFSARLPIYYTSVEQLSPRRLSIRPRDPPAAPCKCLCNTKHTDSLHGAREGKRQKGQTRRHRRLGKPTR